MKIKHIRSDNGTEFKNSGIDDYLDELGITHELSAPYTPQQNGIIERKNRTLVEMARTMLDEYKTPPRFWLEAIDTVCHIINRVYLHKFFKKTSYELLTDKRPNVSYFKVFGCRGYTPRYDPAGDMTLLGLGVSFVSRQIVSRQMFKPDV